jgi:hypothetical protein
MTDRELMQQALEALDYEAECGNDDAYHPLRDALRERLAQPEQEPSIRWDASAPVLLNGGRITQYLNGDIGVGTPAPRQWQGLTEDEACDLLPVGDWDIESTLEFAKAIEAKLKEKNHA